MGTTGSAQGGVRERFVVTEAERGVADLLSIEVDPVLARAIVETVPFWFHTFALNRAEGIYTAGAARDHRYRRVATYFAAATRAALVLTAFSAPYRGRRTPVNAWWGSFDLAANLLSGLRADPPSDDFIMRNAMDAQGVAVGWWPGDQRYGKAAFYAYAHPAPEGFANAKLSPPAAHWDATLGEFILDWDDVCAGPDPHAAALAFARSAFHHACLVCEWDPALPASAEGQPPPVR